MKTKIFFFAVFLIFCGCKKEVENSKKVEKLNPVLKLSYKEHLNKIQQKSEQEKKDHFFKYINSEIPEYWENTPWSFNGTTREPQKGSIACGYFVTNILSDYGFNIKRTYLAQQASSVMIKQLCINIKYFSKREDLESYLKENEKHQVYIVGLDFHTGFVTRESEDTYFIHSNYISNQGVIKEKTTTSAALNASKSFMIGNLKYSPPNKKPNENTDSYPSAFLFNIIASDFFKCLPKWKSERRAKNSFNFCGKRFHHYIKNKFGLFSYF